MSAMENVLIVNPPMNVKNHSAVGKHLEVRFLADFLGFNGEGFASVKRVQDRLKRLYFTEILGIGCDKGPAYEDTFDPVFISLFSRIVGFNSLRGGIPLRDHYDIFSWRFPCVFESDFDIKFLANIQLWGRRNPLGGYPSPLIKSHSLLGGLQSMFSVVGSSLQLIYGVRHSAVDILSGVRELLGRVGLIARSVGLRSGIVDQFVGLSSARNHFVKLSSEYDSGNNRNGYSSPCQPYHGPLKSGHPTFYVLFGGLELLSGCWLCWRGVFASIGRNDLATAGMIIVGIAAVIHGAFVLIVGTSEIVTQKHLTAYYLCNTVIHMANVLNTDKQIAVIGALAEGSSIRSIERITGVHRDTIMRLGVKVGQGCAALMDAKMRNLPCTRLELDEIWGFIGKKETQRPLG